MPDLSSLHTIAGWAITIIGTILIIIFLSVMSSQKPACDGTGHTDAEASPEDAPENDGHGNKHYAELPERHYAEFDTYPNELKDMLRLPVIGSTVNYRIGQNYESVGEFIKAYPIGVIKQMPEYAVPTSSNTGSYGLMSSIDNVETVDFQRISKMTFVKDTVEPVGLCSLQLENGKTMWLAELKIISRSTDIKDLKPRR